MHKLLRKALVGSGFIVLVLVLAAAVALGLMRDRQNAIMDVLFEAISEADTGHIALLDAEASIRAFLVTGDPIALEPANRLSEGGDEAAAPDVEALLAAQLGEDHPVLVARADAAEAVRAWYDEVAQPLIESVQAGGPNAVTPAQVAEGAARFQEVDALQRAYITALRDERAQAVNDLRTLMEILTAVFATLVAFALAAGVLLWVYLQRWVTRPLSLLAEDVRRVASGDTDHVVNATGPGEVGDVADDVEQMRARLTLLLAEASAARTELEDSHAALAAQAEDLRRSNRDLEQFAYVASHDLQEPLRKVASFTQLLSTRYGGQLDERADQYINFAVDGATRMQRLINDLLDFSRVGRIGGETGDVDMDAVVQEAIGDLEPLISEAEATVTVGPLPKVRGEYPLLVQLVRNLIGNAVKFRDPQRACQVRLEARRKGELWEFSCQDNGIGIDFQYAERVFVIFQRLHARDVYEGTGIGLAVCKKIVEYHGGEIWVEEAPQEGTTVRWTLPTGPDSGTVKAPRTTGRQRRREEPTGG